MTETSEAPTRLTVPLSEIGVEDVDLAGRKAATLGALRRNGFPVPDGVVVPADVHRAVGAPSDGSAGDGSPHADGDANRWRDLGQTLGDVLESLGGHVAVRSSGLAEDRPDASFAGQYVTVLGVRDARQAFDAVRRCWASVDTPAARRYRAERGVEAAPMAVLVQTMVDADVAGVAFSADPVSGDRDEVVISAVRGLGDRLVNGEVSPDEWVVRGAEATRRSDSEEALDADGARAVADLARRVQDRLGLPQDIEWAIADGVLHLLQARPITSLPPTVEPVAMDVEAPPGFWQYDASHHPRPLHHVERCFFPAIRRATIRWAEDFGYLFDGLEFRDIALRPYLRMAPLGGKDGPPLPLWLMRVVVRLHPALRRRIQRAADAVASDMAGRYVERWYDEWQPELEREIGRLLAVDLGALADTELDAHVGEAFALFERGVLVHTLLHGALAWQLYELVVACEEWLGWDLARTMDLFSGTSTMSTRPAHELHRIAAEVRRRPAVRDALLDRRRSRVPPLVELDAEIASAFDDYVESYGHRALGYTIAEPTLAELPQLVLDMLRGQVEQGYDPTAERAMNAHRRAASRDAAHERLADRPADRARFDELLARAERAYPVREDNEFFTMSAPLAVLRYAVLEIGRRLARRGVIEEPDDVMFLELEEARTANTGRRDLRRLVRRRKGERAWALSTPAPESFGEPPAAPPSFDFLPRGARLPMQSIVWHFEAMMAMDPERPAGGSDHLRGMAASPGRHVGPVRVIHDETEFSRLRPGDVLVCPITSPVWSVLFPSVAALVTDTGGVLSHPAIIAREYGIPAVVATGTATELLRDGETVTVDGDAGVVLRGGA